MTLDREIARDPTNADAYLVLADALLAAGDRHGELITVQAARRAKPNAKALATREAALLKELGPELFGSLWPIAKRRARRGEGRAPIHVEWFCGFMRSIRLSCDGDDDTTTVAAMLPAILALPAARFVQHLAIGNVHHEVTNPDYAGVIELLEGVAPRTLTSLFFGDFTQEDWKASWNTIGAFDVLSRTFPKLAELRIHSCGPDLAAALDLGKLALPKLRVLEIETDHTSCKKLLAQIANGKHQALERLAISFGVNAHDEAKLSDLQPILDGKKLPKLTALSLEWIEIGPALVEALVSSKIASRLVHLGLRSAHIHDASIDLLLANKPRFKALRSIDLGLNHLTKPAQKRAKKLCEHVELDTQWDPSEDYLLD